MNDYIDFMQPLQNELAHRPIQRWADLGCGSGVFTEALATILPAGSTILAIDKNEQQLPPVSGKHVAVQFIQADFETQLPDIYPLDGILIANALHYVREKGKFIESLEHFFSKQNHFIIAEYETDIANNWVPFPISFERLTKLFQSFGYDSINKVNTRTSIYGGSMYLTRITKR